MTTGHYVIYQQEGIAISDSATTSLFTMDETHKSKSLNKILDFINLFTQSNLN